MVFAVGGLFDDVRATIPEHAQQRSYDGGIAHSSVGIEDTMNRAPVAGDHQLPDAPADMGLHVLLQSDVVGVRTGDASDLTVDQRLSGFCRVLFRFLDARSEERRVGK